MTLLNSFEIAAQGMDTQVRRVELAASNIANLATPNYIRKIPVVREVNQASFDDVLAQMKKGGSVFNGALSFRPQGAYVEEVANDPTPGKKIYRPNHPDADKDGYITMSNSNILGDMADSMISSRMYEANLAVIGITKAMANKAVDIGRGQ